MTYGYIRVSTDTQTVENQKLVIKDWCRKKRIKIDSWTEETISGTKKTKDRKLGGLLNSMQPGDTLIVTEISRLGRSITMIFEQMQFLLDRNIHLYAVKENFSLANDIQSKVLVFAFGLSAEIERNLISERTKAGLTRARKKGKQLGHPKGYKLYNCKLRCYEKEIRQYLKDGKSIYFIAKKYGTKWDTAKRFITNFLDMDKPEPIVEKPKKHGHPSKQEIDYFKNNP